MKIITKTTLFDAQYDGNYIFELWISIFFSEGQCPLTALGESIRAQSSTTPLYTYYTMLLKNVIQSPDKRLSRKVYRGHLQCGQTRKSTECVIVNVSDVVEG